MLEQPYASRRANDLDRILDVHGSYERMRSVRKSLEYVSKEDPSPTCHNIRLPDFLLALQSHTKTVTAEIADRLVAGDTLQQINNDKENHSFVMRLG